MLEMDKMTISTGFDKVRIFLRDRTFLKIQ